VAVGGRALLLPSLHQRRRITERGGKYRKRENSFFSASKSCFYI